MHFKVNWVKPLSTVVGTAGDDLINLVLRHDQQPMLQKFYLEIIDSSIVSQFIIGLVLKLDKWPTLIKTLHVYYKGFCE